MTGIDARTDQERARLPCLAESQASKRCVVSWSRPEFAALIRTIPVTAARTEKGVARSSVQSRTDRKSVEEGKSVSVRVDLGGRRIIKKTIKKHTNRTI